MKRARLPRIRRAERGVATIVFVLTVPVLLGVIGLAVDLGRIYARKAELQSVADAIALAAAGKLDGTMAGMSAAYNAAYNVGTDSYYAGGSTKIHWNDSALSFASSPSAPDSDWVPVTAVNKTNVANLLYARLDTDKLVGLFDDSGGPGGLTLTLANFLSGINDSFSLSTFAVAGKLISPITPLAVCAMDNNPTGSHANNGVASDPLAYGFRTGVNYNLLQLNRNGGTGVSFLVNPIDPTDHYNNATHFDQGHMKTFMCAGSVALGQVVGKSVYVKQVPTDFTAQGWDLVNWLNSRFGTTTCDPAGAPPDSNVREFNGNFGDYPQWYMAVQQYPRSVADSVVRTGSPNQLVAVPDLAYQNDTWQPSQIEQEICFGPLWAYSKPKNFSASQWPNMYQYTYPDPKDSKKTVTVKVTASTNYPSSSGADTPYLAHVLAPAGGGGVKDRRVLNIPLLDCSGGTPSGTAKVLAIGRFFMSAKATDTVIPGEFAGTYNVVSPAVLFR